MNQPINVSDAVQRLSRVAAEFVAPPKARSQNILVPFADVVRELREKGASFGLIVELLAGEQVSVSRFVVARFCRERLGPRCKGETAPQGIRFASEFAPTAAHACHCASIVVDSERARCARAICSSLPRSTARAGTKDCRPAQLIGIHRLYVPLWWLHVPDCEAAPLRSRENPA
jgi:hypothetical protein